MYTDTMLLCYTFCPDLAPGAEERREEDEMREKMKRKRRRGDRRKTVEIVVRPKVGKS